jgi:hypothetical protein
MSDVKNTPAHPITRCPIRVSLYHLPHFHIFLSMESYDTQHIGKLGESKRKFILCLTNSPN